MISEAQSLIQVVDFFRSEISCPDFWVEEDRRAFAPLQANANAPILLDESRNQ